MEQRSDEWHKARHACITASKIGCVMAKPTTKKYQEYMKETVDALKGVPYFEKPTEPWFEFGIENEDEAIRRFEWETGLNVRRVGFIKHSDYPFIGCSPDGLIEEIEDEGIEVKCRSSIISYRKARDGNLTGDYHKQQQSSMWIMNRSKWRYINYFKGILNGSEVTFLAERTIKADLELHKKIEQKCLEFWEICKQKSKQ